VADGQAVRNYPDRSGNGFSVTQTLPANQPVFNNSASYKLVNFNPFRTSPATFSLILPGSVSSATEESSSCR